MYISGGENVYPAEVEDALLSIDGVADAAVLGVPDERWGEVGVAFVVLEPGASLSAEDVLECVPRAARALQGARLRALPRRAPALGDEQGAEGRAARGGPGVTETALPLGADGRTLSGRGVRTRGRLLEAAEQIFADVGFHEASIVKITEAAGVAQGTFYLYFESKKQIFDELVRDLNSRVRHAMKEASSKGTTRVEAEVLGFAAYFRFTSEHKALYRIIRQAEFVSPEMLRYHYDRLSEGYVEGLREAVESGEIGDVDPKVTAWALMGMGELIGLRWILMENRDKMPKAVLDELERIIGCVLEARP